MALALEMILEDLHADSRFKCWAPKCLCLVPPAFGKTVRGTDAKTDELLPLSLG
jgi:hypothetical protein